MILLTLGSSRCTLNLILSGGIVALGIEFISIRVVEVEILLLVEEVDLEVLL